MSGYGTYSDGYGHLKAYGTHRFKLLGPRRNKTLVELVAYDPESGEGLPVDLKPAEAHELGRKLITEALRSGYRP